MPKSKTGKQKQAKFDYSLDYANLDLREQPELYRIGVGEQGVFHVQPYKSELLPLWRFATPAKARESVAALMDKFESYKSAGDGVGVDMVRKYVQMGWTRSRRYAKHAGGRKRDASGARLKPAEVEDRDKAESASVFKAKLDEIRADEEYNRLLTVHRDKYERRDLKT